MKTKNWFNIKNFIFISLLFLYVVPITLDLYDWTKDEEFLFLIFMGLVGFFFSIILFDKLRYKQESNTLFKFEFNTKIIKVLTGIVILYYIVQISSLDIYSFSKFISFLVRDRVGEYLSNPIVERSVIIKPIIDTISYILICFYWRKCKYKIGNLIWFIVLLNKLLLSHTRFIILIDLLIPIFYYNYYVKKVKMKTLVTIFLVALLFISVGNFARGGSLNTYNLKQALSPSTVFNQTVRASSGSTNSFYKFYKSNSECDFLKQYYLYLPISLIPRAIWPKKPIVSYFWRVTKEITGMYPLGKFNPVLTTTFLGEAYHQLGLLGIFFSSILYLVILLKSMNFINKFQYTELIIFKIIIHIPMDIRGGLNSFLITQISIIYPLILLLIISIYKSKKIQDKNIFNMFL